MEYKRYWKQLTNKEKERVRLSWNECEGIEAEQIEKGDLENEGLINSFECYWDCFEFNKGV